MTETRVKRARRCTVHVDDRVCDGCEVCVYLCKPAVFELSSELNRRGVYPALPRHAEHCNNCRLCVLGCPQLAIAVFAVDDADDAGSTERAQP